MTRPCAVVLSVWTLLAPADFASEVWEANQDIYQQILQHPFLRGLSDGSLDRKAFSFYMIQDARYLTEFAEALRVTAAKAPSPEWADLLNRHAREAVEEERRLHESVFAEYGISREEQQRTEPSPEAFAYTSFLIATAHRGSFAESVAALLPCYWIYWEVGKQLARRGSRDPVYQKWIDAYASEGYGGSVKAVIAIANEMAARASAEERARMRDHFRRSSRYEWMFWDSALHRRPWPPPSE